MKWKPIDTAPKDGTDILLFVPTLNRQVWLGCYNVHESYANGKLTTRFEGWNFGLFGSCGLEKHEPTQWMPLPAPPNA